MLNCTLAQPVERDVINKDIWGKYQNDVSHHIEGYKSLSNDINTLFESNRQKGSFTTYGQFAQIVQHNPITLFDKFIAGKISDLIKDVPIRFKDFANSPGFTHLTDHAAMFDGKNIWVNTKGHKNTVDLLQTINHEGIHAATAAWLDANPHDPKAKLLWKIVDEVRKDSKYGESLKFSKEDPYGLNNAHEFMAELANPEFTDFLSKRNLSKELIAEIHSVLGTKPNSIRTAWSGFVQIMAKILGFEPHETNALAATFHLFDHIIKDRTTKGIKEDTTKLQQLKQPISLGSLFDKDKLATASDIDMGSEAYKDLIKKYLTTSRSLEDFTTKLRLFQKGADYQNSIVSKAAEFWANRNRILTEADPSVYSKLDKSTQRETADLRPGELMLKEDMPKDGNGNVKPLAEKEDISQVGRFFNVAAIASQIYRGLGGKVLKNVISNTQELKNQGTKLYQEMAEHLVEYKNLGRKGQLNITKIAIKFDGILNDTLVNAGLQWPTADMLAKEGLSPKEISAYRALTKALDKSYELIASAFKVMGRDPPERIPGYFPHFWVGSWKVWLNDKTTGKPVELRTFNSGKMAMQYAQIVNHMQSDGAVTALLEKPKADMTSENIASLLIRTTDMYGNRKSGLNQAILKTLMKMDESAKRGIIRDVLDRKMNIDGHEAFDGISPYNYLHNSNLIAAYQKHLESVSKFWADTHIANEVGGFFHENLDFMKNTPHLKEAISEFIGRSTGSNVNHVKIIDTGLRSLAISLQLNPGAFHSFGMGMSHFMSVAKLIFPNPKFLASNILQPLTTHSDIMLAVSERAVNGDPIGNPMKAMGAFWSEFSKMEQGNRSPILQKALDWAIENHQLSAFQADHINPLKDADVMRKAGSNITEKLPAAIEERGRRIAFLSHYMYFKDLMPTEQALHAASLKMDTAMGNYQRMNSAGMFTDMGIIGQSIRPFGLLRSVYWGKTYQSILTVADALKQAAKDPKTAGRIPAATGAFIAMQGSYLLFAGAAGMIGSAEYDAAVKLINTTFNPEVPLLTTGEWLRKHGAHDWSLWGLLGQVTGINIGTSLNAQSLTELGAAPGASATANFAQMVAQAMNKVTGEPVDYDKLWAATRANLPPTLAAILENEIAKNQGGGIPRPTSLDALLTRTPTEANIAAYSGAHAITEDDRRQQLTLKKYEDGLERAWKQKIVSSIVTTDAFKGDSSKLWEQALSAEKGFDSQTLKKAVMDEINRRILDQELRNQMQLLNERMAQRYQDFKQMESLKGK